jgi:glycosyltransferase involved in cell wall biosynthesis
MKHERPRILHIGKFYAPQKGGIETHLRILCGEMRKYADLRVVVAGSGTSIVDEIIDGVWVRRVPTPASLAAAPLCPAMVGEIRRSDADIVHLHLPNPSAILAYLASGHRKTLVCSYHSDVVRQKLLGAAFQPFLMRTLRRSAAVVAATRNYVESSPVLRTFKDRCHVIPYGIPVGDFERADPEAVQAIKDRYGPNIIVAVGRLVYYKGFKYLIRAMQSVSGRLLLIGTGPLRAALEAEAREQGVADRVVFLEQVENVIPYYHSAELFVLPSVARSESFGIVQLEAMACGKPVINTGLDSGVTFVSVDKITGLTVPPEDARALAAAITFLLEHPELRAQYGAAARDRVRQLFTVETMADSMLQLYTDVCDGFARPQPGILENGAFANGLTRSTPLPSQSFQP